MKRMLLTILALSMLSMQLDAAPFPRPRPRMAYRYHPHSRFRPSTVVKSISQVPWQTVLAGGAAASGVVFAYKVADGIQTGTVEAARSSPDAFLKNGMDAVGTVKAAVMLSVAFVIVFMVWRLTRHRKPPA